MKKNIDTYQWTKDRIKLLYGNVENWHDIEITTPKHDFWSIKKLIALDYYIVPFVRIMRSKGFDKWYYIDPFCGSGMLEFTKKYRFPGSPLIPLFRFDNFLFSDYYLSDIDSEYINALEKCINRVSRNQEMNIHISAASFSSRVEKLFPGTQPESWKKAGYLAFLDPLWTRYRLEKHGTNSEKQSSRCNIYISNMGHSLDRSNELAEQKLTSYFGGTGGKN